MLYKIHPAIVASVADKIEIQLAGGKSKRVRDKDVTLLHPGPLSSLGALHTSEPAIEEAWELLEGEEVGLSDLAEILFGEFSPAAAWGTWEVLQDGLYFEGGPQTIRRRGADAGQQRRRVGPGVADHTGAVPCAALGPPTGSQQNAHIGHDGGQQPEW